MVGAPQHVDSSYFCQIHHRGIKTSFSPVHIRDTFGSDYSIDRHFNRLNANYSALTCSIFRITLHKRAFYARLPSISPLHAGIGSSSLNGPEQQRVV